MDDLTTKHMSIPAAEALSERSQKFYDGTYVWDSEGFTDDVGVHRNFDCYDPDARAPTPLPPMSLSGSERDQDDKRAVDDALPEPRSGGKNKTFVFASNAKSKGEMLIVRSDELFRNRVDGEHLIGKIECVLIASRANEVDLTIKEYYQLCGIPYLDAEAEKSLRKSITPPTSPLAQQAILSTIQTQESYPVTPTKSLKSKVRTPTSSSSLSDCPSDISEWDVGKPVWKYMTVARNKDPEKIEEEAREPRSKPTTPGVAQKVKKGAKKTATKSTTPSSAFLSLQSGSYLRGTGSASRRRSARQADTDGDK